MGSGIFARAYPIVRPAAQLPCTIRRPANCYVKSVSALKILRLAPLAQDDRESLRFTQDDKIVDGEQGICRFNEA